jgi:hypothetical protein
MDDPMTIMPINRPFVLSSMGVPVRSFTLTEVPTGPGAALANPNALLTISDTNSLFSTGTALWSTPLSALLVMVNVGQPVPLGGGTTSQGLALVSLPQGCALSIDFG